MDFEKRARELVSQMTLMEKMSQLRFDAPAIERLGVPAYTWWNEALHGVARAGTATVFPQAIGLAAAFDEENLHAVAEIISEEGRAKYNAYKKFGDTGIYQGLTFWSPNINLFRDPRWGRGHETYGEDPFLTARLGTAFVRGIQGDGEYRRADATLKHYAVHSGPEALRHVFDARVSKQDLYETYLVAFRYCIEHAKPSAVMGAYNRTNGEVCCGSKTLLQDILREEFGFDGYVVSDCGAICDFHETHRVTRDMAASAALAVNNGCQLNCGRAYHALQVAYQRGDVSEETITEAVVLLFTARFRLGMFDQTDFDTIPYEKLNAPEHRAFNLQTARETIVLLKNDGILPLKKGARVAVIGPNADNVTALLGNYNGIPDIYSTPLRGIQEKTEVLYAPGCRLYLADDRDMGFADRDALVAAKNADVVILCMGLDGTLEGEQGDGYNSDCSGDKPDLKLPESQRLLCEKIFALEKPIVFVNISGSAIDLRDAHRRCNAVVQCFYPGARGGEALADVLFGDVSPSGRLPVTFYNDAGDLPPFTDYAMENRTYRFFEGDVLYPFGFGLGYNEIAYENIRCEAANGAYTVYADVLNRGETPQRQVTQLYASFTDSRTRTPKKQLCAIDSTVLGPGERKTVVMLPERFWLSAVLEDGSRVTPDGEIRFTIYTGSQELPV